MPNRIIKDSVNESRGLSSCTFFAQDLYKRLITYADDYGRFNADPEIMLARLYPRDLATVTLCDINDALIELSGVRKIGFYTSAPRREVFACFPNWNEHQRIRDSKHKMPDPTNTDINDWYYRRHIPLEMKVAIIERDGFVCKACGQPIAQCNDARRVAKMGSGFYHIDHIVPCQQGGRATMENLRLTCAKCNQARQKLFSFDEIVQFSATGANSPQFAADSGLIQSNPNPIQSESESESNPNITGADAPDVGDEPPKPLAAIDRRFDEFWTFYPKKIGKGAARKSYDKIKPSDELHKRMLAAIVTAKRSDQWTRDGGQYIPNPATWLNQQRWDDEPRAASRPSQPALSKAEQFMEMARRYEEAGE